MNTFELGVAIAMSGELAVLGGIMVQGAVDVYKDIKAEIDNRTRIHHKHNRRMRTILKEAWLNPGDEVTSQNGKSAIIIGSGLNDTVSIMYDDGFIEDVTVNNIRKVVVL